VGTWSVSTSSTVVWQQLSGFTEANGVFTDGVDFVLAVDDQYPLRVSDTRPAQIVNDIEVP
jgi:hypothetical protein